PTPALPSPRGRKGHTAGLAEPPARPASTPAPGVRLLGGAAVRPLDELVEDRVLRLLELAPCLCKEEALHAARRRRRVVGIRESSSQVALASRRCAASRCRWTG